MEPFARAATESHLVRAMPAERSPWLELQEGYRGTPVVMNDQLGGLSDDDLWEDLFSPESPPLEGSTIGEAILGIVLAEFKRWLISAN